MVYASFSGFITIYPLVNVYITNWKITMFHGQISYFDLAIFNSELLLYQGVHFMAA